MKETQEKLQIELQIALHSQENKLNQQYKNEEQTHKQIFQDKQQEHEDQMHQLEIKFEIDMNSKIKSLKESFNGNFNTKS